VEIKNQERDFRAIENFRDNLVVQLSSLANNTIETVERFENKYDKESVLNKMEEIKQHVAEIEIPKKLPLLIEIEKPEPEVTEAAVVLNDETPEVAFEIVATPEESNEPFLVEEEILEEEPEMVLEQEEVAAVIEEIKEVSVPTVKVDDLSPADAALEMVEQMRKSRETPPVREAVNTFREKPQEPVLPKSSGGSFFDQI
ncbi:MAG: cell division protein DivIVA, partial [Dyadobacter sp.]